jgi:hypothetical protein
MAAYPSSASVRRTPVVKRNYCLRSQLKGLVFTLNHIAVNEDSAIVCVHESDEHHGNHHWRRRRRPHPRRWGWGPRRRRWRPLRRWRRRPLRPKTAFPYDCAPLVPTAESWGARPAGRLSRGGICVLSERPVGRFASRTPVLMSRDQVVVSREASSGNLLRTKSAVTRFPAKSPPCRDHHDAHPQSGQPCFIQRRPPYR